MLIGVGAATLAVTGAWARDALDGYLWRSRVLVVSAPDPADPRIAAQRRAVAGAQAGVRARDLVVLVAAGRGAAAEALRGRLGLPAAGFRAVLVGKDGGAKLTADAPIPTERLFSTIDAMPMRRAEMRRAEMRGRR